MKLAKTAFILTVITGMFATLMVFNPPAKAQAPVSVSTTGQFNVKVKGASVSITRFEDQENKSVCYITEVGSIGCVKK